MALGSSSPLVIVGGGQAAVQACLALRKEKVTTPILMLSEEADFPYHRPPLSKSYLTGETDDEKLAMRPVSFYESKNVQVELNCRVSGIDLENRSVVTQAAQINYQSLIIATGARPRALQIPGAELNGVHVLRDVEQARSLKIELGAANNVVIIGAGFIGLEIAANANAAGKKVTVFDMADRVMARAVSPDVSSWFEQTHRSNGIDIRLNDSVDRAEESSTEGDSRVSKVVTAGGEEIDCDLLIIGIGVVPNSELAVAAGIECDNGILVNEFCETSISGVYAIGDCAMHPNPFYSNKFVRLESVQNATDQARTVASVIAGNKKPYHSVPWFWSDQGEHSLQMAGLSDNADLFVQRNGPVNGQGNDQGGNQGSVVAGSNSFSVFHYGNGKLQCVDSVNSPRDHMMARKLISEQRSPTPEQAADPDFELKSLFT